MKNALTGMEYREVFKAYLEWAKTNVDLTNPYRKQAYERLVTKLRRNAGIKIPRRDEVVSK